MNGRGTGPITSAYTRQQNENELTGNELDILTIKTSSNIPSKLEDWTLLTGVQSVH